MEETTSNRSKGELKQFELLVLSNIVKFCASKICQFYFRGLENLSASRWSPHGYAIFRAHPETYSAYMERKWGMTNVLAVENRRNVRSSFAE